MKRGLFLLALLLSSPAPADDYLNVSLVSKHFNDDDEHCETNPGVEYQRFTSIHVFYMAGAYYNSECNTAAIAWVGWESRTWRPAGVPLALGAMGGLSTGYNSPVVGTPYLRIGKATDMLHAKLLFLPSDQPIIALVLGFRL